MSAHVIVSPAVYTLSRAQTIYHVICEWVKEIAGFAASDIIRRGVLDKQYLRAIYIIWVNEDREKVSEVVLTIDWEKHQVFASAPGMNSLTFDSAKSISQQLSGALFELKNYVSKLRTEDVRAEVWYSLRADLPSHDDACRELGLPVGPAKQLEWAKGKYIRAKFRAERLQELGFDVRSRVE